MRVLCGIIRYSAAKDYIVPKFVEMLEQCIMPIEGVDVAWALEEGAPELPGDFHLHPFEGKSLAYAEDMLMIGRESFRTMAIMGEYDAMLWQGIDALWQSREDVEKILKHLEAPGVPVVAPLISARADSNFAIARRFVSEPSTSPLQFTEDQVDIPVEELSGGSIIPSGFPGADNIALRKDTFDVTWMEGNHDQWYKRVAEGRPNICCEEWLIRELRNRGQFTWLDTSVKVWHVHEDGVARMWPGIEKPLADLSW